MAGIQSFRSALNGFHRKDVVDYIAYMNNKHNAEKEQLNNQLQSALAKTESRALQEKLEAAEARIQELEELLARQPAPESVEKTCSEEELEAYRRAERAERQANERARQIYDQANGVLAEATVKVEDASAHISSIADLVTEQLKDYQQSVQSTKEAFREAVAALSSIRPESAE